MTVPSGASAGARRAHRAAKQVVPLTEAPEARSVVPMLPGRTAMGAAHDRRRRTVPSTAAPTRCAPTGGSAGTGPTVQTVPNVPTGALSPTGRNELTGPTAPAARSVPPGPPQGPGAAAPDGPGHASRQPRRAGTLTPTLKVAPRRNVSDA